MAYIGVITHLFKPLILTSWDIQVIPPQNGYDPIFSYPSASQSCAAKLPSPNKGVQ